MQLQNTWKIQKTMKKETKISNNTQLRDGHCLISFRLSLSSTQQSCDDTIYVVHSFWFLTLFCIGV